MKRSKIKSTEGRAPILIPKPNPAASPGTVAPPLDAQPPRLHVMVYNAAGLEERDLESVAMLKEYHQPTQVLWADVTGIGDAATFNELGELFGLHPLALEDVVNLHQRPKAEDYDDHAYVVLQVPTHIEAGSLEQLSIFFGSNFVITVQKGHSGDRFEPVRQRIRSGRGRIRKAGADYLAYAVMDAVVDRYFHNVEWLNSTLEELEEQIIGSANAGSIAEIHAVRHDLHTLRGVLSSSREALGLLARGETGPIADETIPFLRDCHDHTAQLLDAVEALRELSKGLMDLHMGRTSNQMNEVMKVLTMIATIFIPLSFIAGLYGMNFDGSVSPWNMPELGWRLGYPFALAIMLLTALGFLFFFRHRGWLGKSGKKPSASVRKKNL